MVRKEAGDETKAAIVRCMEVVGERNPGAIRADAGRCRRQAVTLIRAVLQCEMPALWLSSGGIDALRACHVGHGERAEESLR
jgi:hypothetical protein